MKFDLHTHHERCGHAVDTIRDYVEAAIAKDLQIIGISDHSPYFAEEDDHPYPYITMPKSDFENYVNEVLKLKEQYKDKIEVLLGLESDFFEEHAELYQSIYANYPFDYIIGSVHLSNGVSIFNKNRWKKLTKAQMVAEKEEYYRLIEQSANSGMFDILGHIDAMKGYYPNFTKIQTEAVDKTLQVIADQDVAIEINTSGKTKDCGGWYPAEEILEKALFYGVQVTFGSDAHEPARVGDDWEEVVSNLKHIGFKHWAYFRQRKRYFVSL